MGTFSTQGALPSALPSVMFRLSVLLLAVCITIAVAAPRPRRESEPIILGADGAGIAPPVFYELEPLPFLVVDEVMAPPMPGANGAGIAPPVEGEAEPSLRKRRESEPIILGANGAGIAPPVFYE